MAQGGVKLRLAGGWRVKRLLAGLPAKFQKKLVRKAMREAMKPVAKDAKKNAPVLSGLLKISLRVSARKFRNRHKFGIQLGTSAITGVPIFYALFNELGTRHQPARPFMRPALKKNKDRVFGIMAQSIRKGIEAEAKRG